MGPKAKKRKKNLSNDLPSCSINEEKNCILHNKNLSDAGKFVSFNECKKGKTETLSFLHSIRDKRLSQDTNSKYRMKDICDLIPESLEEENLDIIGWHRKCYQAFVKNIDRL